MATSQNNYTANDMSRIVPFTIPGTDRKVNLRKGAPGQLLVTFAGWFDKHIESVDGGIFDDWGYANRAIRGQTSGYSNHASGTALDLNATRHPLGKSGTFSSKQAKAIRAELARYEGAIRWGGDYQNRKDEMHFEINADVKTCERVLAKVTKPKEKPMNNVEQGRVELAAMFKSGEKALTHFTAAGKDREAVASFVFTLREFLRAIHSAESKLPEK